MDENILKFNQTWSPDWLVSQGAVTVDLDHLSGISWDTDCTTGLTLRFSNAGRDIEVRVRADDYSVAEVLHHLRDFRIFRMLGEHSRAIRNAFQPPVPAPVAPPAKTDGMSWASNVVCIGRDVLKRSDIVWIEDEPGFDFDKITFHSRAKPSLLDRRGDDYPETMKRILAPPNDFFAFSDTQRLNLANVLQIRFEPKSSDKCSLLLRSGSQLWIQDAETRRRLEAHVRPRAIQLDGSQASPQAAEDSAPVSDR